MFEKLKTIQRTTVYGKRKNNQNKKFIKVYKFSKYRAKKVEIDNIKFDSEKEAKRYLQLKELQNNNKISNLRLQVKFELIPKQTDTNNKFKYHQISYIADFVYYNNETNEEVIEDVKGYKTPEYKLKKKLFYYRYKKDIVEV
jgi:hypothetical protein